MCVCLNVFSWCFLNGENSLVDQRLASIALIIGRSSRLYDSFLLLISRIALSPFCKKCIKLASSWYLNFETIAAIEASSRLNVHQPVAVM